MDDAYDDGMHGHLHRDARVADALDRLDSRDPPVAEAAEIAWGWLVCDDDLEVLQQSDLQTFLWYELPREWRTDLAWHLFAAEALACLCDELGLARYAAVCRSEETEQVLRAWHHDAEDGVEAYRRAVHRSGLDPPDTDALAWGGLMSLEEVAARRHVAAALETAVADGRLVPGRSGWRQRQREVTAQALGEPVPGHPGDQTWQHTVITNRLEHWTGQLGADRPEWRRLTAPLERHLLWPVAVPEQAGEVVAPVQWLLRRAVADDGLRLTDRGNLAPELVRGIVEDFGWWLPGAWPPSREDDAVPVLFLDELVRGQRWVYRRGRRLRPTRRGRALADDTEAAWRALAHALLDAGGFEGFARQGALLVLLDAEPGAWVAHTDLYEHLQVLAAEAGWREEATGSAPSLDAVRDALGAYLGLLGWLHLTEERMGPHAPPATRLGPVGRDTALQTLHAHATAPLKPPVVIPPLPG